MEKTSKLSHHAHDIEAYGLKKKRYARRQRLRDAYFKDGWSRKRIMRHFHASSHTVLLWTQHAEQDCTVDNRGWPKGMSRKHPPETRKRIRKLHAMLDEDPKEFFTGASAIERSWILHFPDTAPPPVRTIGAMMREMHLSTHRKKGRNKGAAAYLHYPEHTVYHGLGGRLIEADFIGRKYLAGRTAPLCFVSFSAKLSPKIRAFDRVEAETADLFIEKCLWFFSHYEEPDFLKLDNAAALLGSSSGKRSVSRVARFLLARGIVPVYAVPRRPFTQASVEGSNSMFARKFWNARRFNSTEEVDQQLHWFNDAARRYHQYSPPVKQRRSKEIHPRMYFLRQVQQADSDPTCGSILVQNEVILLPLPYVKYFVIAEWDLAKEQLIVSFESEKQLKTIHETSFPVTGKTLEL